MHIDIVGAATPGELGDIAGGCFGRILGADSKRLLHTAAAQVYGRHRFLLRLAEMPQQVVERQPRKRALVSTCST